MIATRIFGKTGVSVSEIGFGAWAIGGTWGDVDDGVSKDALNAALDAGMTFIDTADVYGDGRSERLIAEVLRARSGARPYVATKAGRRLPKQVVEGYSEANLRAWIDRSRTNLAMDTLDLVQLHCPPSALVKSRAVFDILDKLKAEKKIADYGVSVEKISEALDAITHPGVVSIQIIFNLFRQRVAAEFLAAAKAANVAVIARVPLASGLLTGKMRHDSVFAADDHRTFNRDGAFFDKGETFSGVPFHIGLEAVEELRGLVPVNATMAAFALKWILMHEAVSVVIPGAKTPAQARANAAASALAPLPSGVMDAAKAIYDARIRSHVHSFW
ncbi:MAG: aldo/keto reductase [Rhizobiaceae bacterium]|jgi:aryl-alcohol dehydrogenase-like predicted oxidoreductase|nr:aldo/keto reductase [Rhizobiaceae bacterium]